MEQVILIVDDDKLMQEAVSGQVLHKGYKTLVASSTSEALDILEKYQINLIITDFEMPGGNGDILLSDLRKKNISVPSILMTGKVAMNENAANKIGADGFLKKPFSTFDLFAEIDRVLSLSD